MSSLIKLIKNYKLVPGVSAFWAWENFNPIHLPKINQPLIIRKESDDKKAFKQVFINNEYDLPFTLENVNNIIDLGSNVGFSVVYFKSQFPNSKIVAIEPSDDNFKQLQINTSKLSNITLLKGGIWKDDSFLKIVDVDYGSMGFVVEKCDQDDPKAIQSFKIETIMKSHDIDIIDILKIDIEGSEKELFEEEYDFWLTKTRCLIVELHDWLKKDTSKVFFNTISKYNFTFHINGENLIFLNNDLN